MGGVWGLCHFAALGGISMGYGRNLEGMSRFEEKPLGNRHKCRSNVLWGLLQ